MIERYVHWNEDIGEWQLKCVAYTGNNMRKAQATTAVGSNKDVSFFFFAKFFQKIGFLFCFQFTASSSRFIEHLPLI